jgi:hypothetical protein
MSREAPIVLLYMGRPELLDVRPSWGVGKLNATTVLLEPLDAGETDELVGMLLDGAEVESGLDERIRAAADGNALLLEEMLAMVRESGGDVAVPPTIRALLAARLDQLGRRRALRAGTRLGRGAALPSGGRRGAVPRAGVGRSGARGARPQGAAPPGPAADSHGPRASLAP